MAAESLRRPHSFLYDAHRDRYKCMIGCNRKEWMRFSEASLHEESLTHRSSVNALNDVPIAPSSPMSPTQGASDLPSHRFSSPLPRSSPPVDMDDDIPDLYPSAGPWLPDDDPNDIFDDYSGPYGAQMPSPKGHNSPGPGDEQCRSELSDSEAEEFEGEMENEDGNVDERYEDRRATSEFEQTGELDPPPLENSQDSQSDGEDFGGKEEGEGREYFGPTGELEDLTEGQGGEQVDDWWPWPNREEALLDIMHAFPRSVFSETELEATLWFTGKCGVQDLPTVRQVKSHREKVLDECGVNPRMVEGKLGHWFAMNDFEKIIQHEMANPFVRKHMHFFGEDAGPRLAQAWQANRWRDEVDADIAGPMVRHAGKDYFVNEPALVNWGGDGEYTAVLPTRFFQRGGKDWAKVHHLRASPTSHEILIDARQNACDELPVSAFFASFMEFKADHAYLGWPDPALIKGIARQGEWSAGDLEVEECLIASPSTIRLLAKGKRVLSLPIWFYCDDTSGNMSKKWNKHNSLLFTFAGLPREYGEVVYNIHFLATSNLAQPLEMFDSVIEFLREARARGIFAYDCELDEVVMLIPWILAMAGDNPMQSEFSSHIGLTGTRFCRVCNVRGADKKNRSAGDAGEFERVSEFLKAQAPRSKESTETALEAQLEKILDGAPSGTTAMATASGSKDKYFQHFAERLSQACADAKARQQANPGLLDHAHLKEELRRVRETMPQDIFSPSLRLDGFDPSKHTPVEILHVLLLGFVKYFWRDAVSRQKAIGKAILKARLNSFDAKSLGLSRIKGHTMVQYAGSLNGADFRIILQVAPSVLHGLIPDAAYNAWLALCRLAPLVFQPQIDDLEPYLERLEAAIDDFLACTALWNTRWFNKPKFHIILHIILHIRLFGPPILYATETFESFNFVIRARSINSNRHAPSLDIARAFSHMHAVRHLVSGGYLTCGVLDGGLNDPVARQAGREVLNLINDKVFVKLMGMQKVIGRSRHGLFTIDSKHPESSWDLTQSGHLLQQPRSINVNSVIRQCTAAVLHDGYVTWVGGFVVFLPTNSPGLPPIIGRVLEILADASAQRLVGLLIQKYGIGEAVKPYQFPSLSKAATPPILCSIRDCLSTVSVIHNCAAHNCAITRTRPVLQERLVTDMLEDELQHITEPDDVLLNLAQLHSARLVQAYQPLQRHPNIPFDDMIHQAIHNRHLIDGTGLVDLGQVVDPADLQDTPSRAPSVAPQTANPALHLIQEIAQVDEEGLIPEPGIRGGRKRPRVAAPSVREYEAELGPQRTRRRRAP